MSIDWNQLSCGFHEVWELRTSRTRFVGTTIGLCDNRAQLVLGTCVIKDCFAKPLLGIEEFSDKHGVHDFDKLQVNFKDGTVWVRELSDVKLLVPPVPCTVKKGPVIWIRLKTDHSVKPPVRHWVQKFIQMSKMLKPCHVTCFVLNK